MSEPQNLAELLAELKAAIAKRKTTVGESYLRATSAFLNLAPRLVKAFDVILRTVSAMRRSRCRDRRRPRAHRSAPMQEPGAGTAVPAEAAQAI